jgi:glutathione S-transferase
MITVHHLNHSRSQRVLWLLEELGVPYEVKYYQRDAKTMLAPPELKAVHPLGKSPVISDGDKTIAETGTIVNYLINKYGEGRLVPKERLRYNYWMHYAEGSAMPLLVMKLVFESIPGQVPGLIRPIARLITGGVQKSYIGPQLATHIAFWDAELQKSAYFAGDELSGADIMMSFPLEAASGRAGLTPRLAAYLAGIHALPAYQKALERGGPYALPGN